MTTPRAGVLITANFANTTGFAWTFFFRLFRAIARELGRREVLPLLSFATIEGPVAILDPDQAFDAVAFDPTRITVAALRRLRRHVRRARVRYAYLTDWPSWHWVFGLLRLWGVRRIVVHSHVSSPEPYGPPAARGLKRLVKHALHRTPLAADAVIACSEFVKRRLVRTACCPPGRISVVYYGLGEERFACVPRDGPAEPLRVFVAARAVRYKGIHVLLEAARLLCERGWRGRFVVRYAGDGPHLADFRRIATATGLAGTFEFLGQVSDTSGELCAADVAALPSVWGDASPITVLEALAAGKPLVTTDAGGIPEEVGDPPAAVVVRPGDAAALADALERLLDDPAERARLGAAARRRAETHFREDRYHRDVVDALLRCYELDRAAPPAPATR
jgi:glycosyltransferase involved in cell wall biosynthesis